MGEALQRQDSIHAGMKVPGDLELVEAVGEGGMGVVWRAHDRTLHRDVAVKVLHPPQVGDDPDATDQFVRSRREARACARVLHPNVVTVHGVGELAGRPFIAMEWIDGETLRQRMDRAGSVDRATSRQWIAAICSAVTHAHDRDVIHCDLKPDNILMQLVGDEWQPRIVDFGLARGVNLVHRRVTQNVGTRPYLAPEAGIRRPSPAVDQYALAMTFAELLGRARPIREAGEWSFGQRGHVDAAVARVLRKGLAKQPANRYRTVRLFASDLVDALTDAVALQPKPPQTLGLDEVVTGGRLDSRSLAGLPLSQLERVVLGVIATVPAGFEHAISRIAPVAGLPSALQNLAAQGLIDGSFGSWALRQPELKDVLLDGLSGPVRRAVCASVADFLAADARSYSWVVDAAMRLYMAAGDPASAARMATEAGRAAVTALERDRRLADAVALVASPDTLPEWLDALLRRLRWLVRCGWVQSARSVLADTLAVASDLQLQTDTDEAMLLAIARAELSLLLDQPHQAVQRTQRILDGGLAAVAMAPHGYELIATHLRAVASDDAVATANALLARLEASEVVGSSALSMAAGELAMTTGNWRGAAGSFRCALAAALDRTDALDAAGAAVCLAESLRLGRRTDEAEAVAADADELLSKLGPVRWTGRLYGVRGALRTAAADPFGAMRSTTAAVVVARENGTIADEKRALVALKTQCAAVGDAAGLDDADEALRRLG